MLKKELIENIQDINIVGGQITSRVEAKSDDKIGEVRVLVPRAIANGRVDHSNLGNLNIKSILDEKKLTKEGDIVLKLSVPYGACVITSEDEGLLVPSFCVIINNLPNYLDKYYLLAFLNSKACIEQIKNLTANSNIAILSVGGIKKINVPIPNKNTQQEIGNNYFKVCEKISILNQIIALEQEKIDVTFSMMEEDTNDFR